MTSSIQFTAVVLCLALAGCTAKNLLRNEKISVRYVGLLMPAAYNSGDTPIPPILSLPPAALVAGQEARFRVTLVANTQGSSWASMQFNASAGSAKVRIIPAFSSRASTGTRIKCNTHTDYWQEYWGLTAASYKWGFNMVTQAYITFTVPPFPYRVCIQAVASYRNVTTRNITNQNFRKAYGQKTRKIPVERFVIVNSSFTTDSASGVWSELSNMDTTVQYVNGSSPYVWNSASTMYTGDFAAIKIQQNGYQHDLYIPTIDSIITADSVKLVPAGFPCTYEKINQREYCSNARVTLKGMFHESCVRDGAIKHGIARIGTNQVNPYSVTSTSYAARTLTLTLIKGGEDLVAYFELPAAGTYDVCFSPKARRTFNATNYLTPIWFKIFKQDATCTGVGATTHKPLCKPTTRLVVSANADALRWSTPHIYPGTWGNIRVYHPTGLTVLSTTKATSWEHSSTREFFTTVGGDQFRLVATSRWTSTDITHGDMYKDSNGNTFKTVGLQQTGASAPTQRYTEFERITSTGSSNTFGASGDYTRITYIGKPDQGSIFTLSHSGGGGCWYGYDDNYGNYGKALNGITSQMTTDCCSVGSNTYCTSTTTCSLSDTDNDGVTASADLGSDPRTHEYAWTHNKASQSEAWAYIRFPIGKSWNVCYRIVGTENWRVITAATGSVNYFDANMYQRLNYTYHVNDSQATTWGPVNVRDPQKKLTTLNLNYVSSDTTVVGSAVKLVKWTASCFTDVGESEAYDTKPGLQECEVGACGGSASCTGCTGHSDDSATARYDVTFYVRMPAQQSSGYYRVCFKNGHQNWMQLQDPKYIKHSLMTSPWKFNTRIAPQLDFALKDWRENTWGKFLIRRLANPYTQAFNIDPNNAFGSGDVVRLVQNRTSTGTPARCDVTWGATSSNGAEFVLQSFDPAKTSWNLGVYCLASSATTTAKCYTGKISPSDSVSGDIGTYPYVDIDSTADGSYLSDATTENAVAFITIPPKISLGTAGYRMCYKPQASNWVEVMKIWNGAPNPFVVGTKPTHVYSLSVGTVYAGQYGYITISGGTTDLDKDIVKLVLDSTGGCDRPAAGTLTAGNSYSSFSWRKLSGSSWTEAGRGGQAYVATSAPTTSATAGSRGTTTSARAYMTFPTVTGLTAVTTNYKVCFMTRTAGDSSEANWQNLGVVGVYSPGIAYTAETQPYNGGVLGVRIVTGGTIMLNTLPQVGDVAKIVSITSPCYGVELAAADRPSGITSKSVAAEHNYVQLGLSAENVTLSETGEEDLGDSNLAATATSRFDATLPWVTAGTRTYYKVCYRPRGLPWLELNQAPLAQQKYALGTDGIYTSDAALSTYTIASTIMGQDPFTSAVYATGITYSSSLIGGAATAAVASSNTSYLYVTYKAEFTSYATDTFKLVLFAEEVVRGVYNNLRMITCNSPGVITSQPGTGTVATSGAATKPSFAINLPTRGGRYLLCYKKTGLDVWLRLEPDSSSAANPFRVIPSNLYFSYTKSTGNFTVMDLYSAQISSKETALGAVSSLDKIYLVNSTDACGISHSSAWDPSAPTSTASLAANIDNAPKYLVGTSNVSQQAALTAPTTSGYYKLCYMRTSTKTMATASTDTLPQPYSRANWYQIDNMGDTSNGGNTPFYVTATATKLRINGCPKFNASRPLRTGTPVDISVSVLDAQNNVLPFSVGTWSYLVTAVASANGFAMSNSGGSCRAAFATQYGWDAFNLRQWTERGVVTFSLAILSGCPTGGCSISFSASDNIKSPGGTDTRVDPAQCTLSVRTTSVTSMSLWEGVTRCRLDDICNARVAVFWTDGGLAHTATDDVMMTATNIGGLSVKANGVALGDTTAVKAGSLANGYFAVSVQFDVTSGSLFTADQAVVLKFSAGGKNATHTMTVPRPKLKKMYIVDLYPETTTATVTGLSDNDKFVRPMLVPSWEPAVTTKYFPGMVSVTEGSSAISAASGYNMVALQLYTAILRPVDGDGRYIDKVALLDPTKPTITIVNTASSFTGNKILKSCDTDEVCDTAFSGVQLSAVRQKISFRLKNAIGCSIASPCTLTFKFDAADLDTVTSITTPVRSVASNLKVTCWQSTATSESALGSGSVGSCPSTTIPVGLALKVEALDMNGKADEYFEGKLLPLLKGGSGYITDSGINLTTVATLKGTGAATISTVSFVKGVAWIFGLTLTKPCSAAQNCGLQLVSDWGANLADVGAIVFTPSTTKLSCSLTSTLYACVVNADGGCDSISGYFGYDSAVSDNNKVSLIYKDTTVCASVSAVDKDGLVTLYETNWVMYWAQALAVSGVTINPVSIVDAGTSPTRVKAMVKGSVSFCFKVDSPGKTKANFKVRFAAQRFNDASYWASSGTNGECSLGTFSFWGKKHVANLAVTKVTDPMTSLTTLPASTASLYAQRADAEKTAIGTTLTFGLLDHYSNAIAAADVDSTQTSNTVVISACSLDDTAKKLSSACTASAIDSTSNIAMKTDLVSNQKEGGVVKASLTSAAVLISSDVVYVLTFERWCLGCYLTFKVKTASGDYKTKYPGATDNIPTARVNLYIVIHAAIEARVLAFKYGTSPWGSYWQKFDTSSQAPLSTTGSVVLFKDTCFSTDKSTCSPVESWFQPTVCDEQTPKTPSIAASKAGDAIQLYVMSATATTGPVSTTTNEPACGVANDCGTTTNVYGQVDILNSYQISIDVGAQVLQCSGVACTDDLTTKPKQNVNALGATAIDAVKRFAGLTTASGYTTGTFPSTSFVVSGVYPSNYYALSSGKLSKTETPSYASKFTVTATSNATGAKVPDSWTTTGYSFVFRGPKIAEKFVVLAGAMESKCPTKPTYSCHGSATACAFDGYQKSADLDTIAYKYAYSATDANSIVPIGIEVPISADVQDGSSFRVATAKGTVYVDLYSWSGCNNGGTMTVKGAINNRELSLDSGRVTAWVSFSAQCERCVLRFTLVPDTTQSDLYATLSVNKGALIQYSQPIDVRDYLAKTGTHLVATSVPSEQKSSLTVADKITVNMVPVRAIGAGTANFMVQDKFASGEVYAYNVIQTSGQNWFWFGNGGALRKDEASTDREHHAVVQAFANTGAASLTFMFTRTCPGGCQAVISFNVNGNLGSFLVKNAAGTTFTVTAVSKNYILVGYRPRMVEQNTDFALSAWHAGDGALIGFAGIGTTTLSPSKASKATEDTVNGDGGDVMDQVFTLDRSEIHRLRVTRTCNRLRLGFGSDNARMNVFTRATYLRLDRPIGAPALYNYPMGTTYASFGVYAVDDLGFIDVRVGGYSGGTAAPCFAYDPMQCPSSFGSDVTCVASADGRSDAGFLPADDNFIAGRTTDGVLLDSNKKIVDGQGKDIRVQFPMPLRNAYPIFKVGGTLTGAASGKRNPVDSNIIDVSVGKTGLNIVSKQSTTGSIAMYNPLTIEVGLVKLVADASSTTATSYIAVEADNLVRATFDASCPIIVAGSQTEMPLKKGYAKLTVSFAAPTTGTNKCTVSLEAAAGSGVCSTPSACKTSFQITVTSVVVTKWMWVSPSALDNAPSLPAGAFFGAMGRTSIFRVGLLGKLTATTDISVNTCDDPATSAKEVCKLTVTVDASCTNKPTIGTDTWNETSGVGSISVTWADVTTGAYTCKMSVAVADGTNKALAIDGKPGGDVEVAVCKPAGIIMTTNTTSVFRDMFLRSGAPYSFSYAIVDDKKAHCRGDSGDAATELSVDIITADRTAKSITSMSVYNTNLTTSAFGWVPPNFQTAKAVGGTVTFTLWFTNSSVNLGLGGFRVRVSPSKGLPTDKGIRADSGVLDTVIAASSLRFHPAFDVPRDWIMGRPMKRIVVQAVDGIDPLWARGVQPNVARKPNEIGNAEKVAWLVDPLPSAGFPLTFSTGQKETTLTQGEAEFVATFSTSRDGVYALSVGTDPKSPVASAKPRPVNFQTLKDVMIVTKHFSRTSPDVCNSDCLLPNQTFSVGTNVTQFLNTTMLQGFNVSIFLADGNGMPVLGENESFVQVRMVKSASSTSTVTLSIPQSYTAKDAVFWAPVRGGRAQFTLGFIGSTVEKGSNTHTPVTLEFSCPATVPAAIAGRPTDLKNPCASGISRSTATTLPIRVIDPSVAPAVFDSPAVQAAKPVIRIPTTITSLAKFNITDFKLELAKRMNAKFPYINGDNAGSVIELTACEVNRATFGQADLGSSVCGASGKCSGSSPTNCPTGVLKCTCNQASTLSALLGRYLLQSTGAEVQIEATYNLKNAVGFSATSEGAIAAAYAALGESTTQILKTDTTFAASFGVDSANVGVRAANAPPATQTPPPTNAPPPPPPPPTTPVPPPPATPTPNSGRSLYVSMTSVLAALLLLALFW